MKYLSDMTKKQMEEFFLGIGEKKFRAKQASLWLCRGIWDFSDMTDFPRELREKLKVMEGKGLLSAGLPRIVKVQRSQHDGTRKYLLELADGCCVESVFMKYKYGNSICISSQAGCRMGCSFCASAIGGLERNLTSGEMWGQIAAVQRDIREETNTDFADSSERIGHVVVMGTGEPFDNYENLKEFLKAVNDDWGMGIGMRNITVSTCGIAPMIKKFGQDFPQVNLAISLHSPNNAIRDKMMPVNKAYPIEELLSACKEYVDSTGRRITFEYTLVKGINDSIAHSEELASLLSKYFKSRKKGEGILCHVNLIPMNQVTESGLKGGGRREAELFKENISKLGIPATVRRELGSDIDAACGQLRLGKISVKNN